MAAVLCLWDHTTQYASVCQLDPNLRFFVVHQFDIWDSCRWNTRYENFIRFSPTKVFTAPLGPSLVANAAFETNQHRSALMKDRMKKFQATKSVTTPGTLLTTAVLQDHENGGGTPGEPKVWVCWQVCSTGSSLIFEVFSIPNCGVFRCDSAHTPRRLHLAWVFIPRVGQCPNLCRVRFQSQLISKAESA
jgi:hypothetical protein